eukprot:COSAG06_NODE_474_length_15284_cov_124.295582_10_plen_128_part_00
MTDISGVSCARTTFTGRYLPTRATTPIPTTWRTPQIHFAPPCFSDAPPHDIAAAIFHPQTEEYHMFPGCWHSGGWQHIQSKDMVSWERRASRAACLSCGLCAQLTWASRYLCTMRAGELGWRNIWGR